MALSVKVSVADKVPPFNVSCVATTDPGAAPKPASAAIEIVPPLIVVVPENVFVPDKVKVPEPDCVNVPVLEITPDKV